MGTPFLAVVGPSGVGKDTLMDAVCAARPDILRVRRVITRSAEAGGEGAEGVDAITFERRRAAGDFALCWAAHGLRYAIPAEVEHALGAGRPVMANVSRGAIDAARARFGAVHVFSVTARAGTLARRLIARGREDREAIARRLRRDIPVPGGAVSVIDNDGPPERAVAQMLSVINALYPPRAKDASR